jgi:hypothetical protein
MENKTVPNLRLAMKDASVYSEVDGLSLQNLFYVYNNFFPNCYMYTRSARDGDYYFDTNKFMEFLEKNVPEDEGMETIKYVTEDLTNKELRVGFCVVFPKHNIFARIENNISESYVLFQNGGEDDLKKFNEALMQFYVEPEVEKNNLYTIQQDQTGFHLIKNPIKEVKNFSIARQYNDDFAIQDEKIQKFIKEKDNSGLVILHGTKGTGKTTYIRHLISSNPERKFVFVPAGLIELLGQPGFQSFLLSLSNHVIILEDCENALRDRKMNGNASSVSILLNMSDGLLSDGLGIKFICTFNEDIKDMDEAITRKGRLVAKYEFKALNVEKSNNLLKIVYVGKNDGDAQYKDENGVVYDMYVNDEGELIMEKADENETFDDTVPPCPTTKKPMTLADIYNYDDESYEIIRKSII